MTAHNRRRTAEGPEIPWRGPAREGKAAQNLMGLNSLPAYDFHSPRVFVAGALAAGTETALGSASGHYLRNVLRLREGAEVLAFNGKDGEWLAVLSGTSKRSTLTMQKQTRPQTEARDLHYLFAPLKHERLDYMVQKAIEMGASRLQPVLTRHTQVKRVNVERMRANAIEAAEQCGVLNVADISEPMTLARAIAARKPDRLLVFCDEEAEVNNPIEALADARPSPTAMLPLTMSSPNELQSIAVLVGPEGGFAEDERAALMKLPNTVRLSLGPRILRADTAAVAALALVQAMLGDWR